MTDDSDLGDFFARETVRIGALIWAGKWRTALQQLAPLGEQLAALGETLPGGLLDGSLPQGHAVSTRLPPLDDGPKLLPPGSIDAGEDAGQNAANMLSCSRGAHAYAPQDSNGWRTCVHCGNVNVTPG